MRASAGELAVEHQRRDRQRRRGDQHPRDQPDDDVERGRRSEHAAALLRVGRTAIARTAELATLLRSTSR